MGKTPPLSVVRARLQGNYPRLSELGKFGNKRKQEKAKATKEREQAQEEAYRDYKLRQRLHGAEQMAREAKEHDVPLT